MIGNASFGGPPGPRGLKGFKAEDMEIKTGPPGPRGMDGKTPRITIKSDGNIVAECTTTSEGDVEISVSLSPTVREFLNELVKRHGYKDYDLF